MAMSDSAALAGKAALVTGASKGIGAGIAEALGRAGANVIVNYSSSRAGADAVVRRIEFDGGRAIAIGASVARESDVDALYEQAKAAFGRLDILVNNAGIFRGGSLEESSAKSFRDLFDTNVLGLFFVTQRFAAQAVDGASIVNISAIGARLAAPNTGLYSATIGAVDVLTQTYAKELGPRGIRVNAISPGFVITEGTRSNGLVGTKLEQEYVAATPLRRAGQPDDVAAVAVYLASDQARWLTGQIISASGGI
jgi:3-oxoacyl-[acyl-carrier protein] reductase